MQKLEKRNTYTPTNASQVRSNRDLLLNRDQSLSVIGLKTLSNTPEVNLPCLHTKGLKDKVYVLNNLNNPLMPCSNTKARKLLKNKKAVVVKLYPFTIKLLFECENIVQNINLGIDSGFQNIGFSCISSTKELILGTLILDSKTSERLKERTMYRRGRRNKLWYREPKFLNRKRKEGYLPPSIQRRYDSHLSLIKRLHSILPITKITIETAKFDIQKLENPEIEGKEYQQGDMYNYQNKRSYLMNREKGLCQLCHQKFSKQQPSHIHHCLERGKEGSNRVKNLAILHKKCHEKLHKKKLKLGSPKQYKPNTFISIINKRFQKDITDLNITYGYITFTNRIKQQLEKTHYNDAFVIAGGNSNIERTNPIVIKQKHRNNRCVQLNRKGFKPSIRRKRYSIQPKDIVWVDNKKHISKGTQSKGIQILVEDSKKIISIKNIQRVYNFGSFCYS